METVSLIVNAMVVGVAATVFGFSTKGRFEHLEKRMDRLEANVNTGMISLRSDMNALRSDLTQVALAVGANPRAQSGS